MDLNNIPLFVHFVVKNVHHQMILECIVINVKWQDVLIVFLDVVMNVILGGVNHVVIFYKNSNDIIIKKHDLIFQCF